MCPERGFSLVVGFLKPLTLEEDMRLAQEDIDALFELCMFPALCTEGEARLFSEDSQDEDLRDHANSLHYF